MTVRTVRFIKWALLAGMTLLWLGLFVDAFTAGDTDWGAIIGQSGTYSWWFLAITVYIGLIKKVFRDARWFGRLVPLRKWTGIFALLFAVTHAYAVFAVVAPESVFAWWRSALTPQGAQLLGWIGLLCMVPALVTGGTYMTRRLGGALWKSIQRFVHVAFIGAGLHITLIPYFKGQGIDVDAALILALYFVGYAFVYIRLKREIAAKAAATLAVVLLLGIGGISTVFAHDGVDDDVHTVQEEDIPWQHKAVWYGSALGAVVVGLLMRRLAKTTDKLRG
jgi:DMSO/TMAO reductase YedYZ heme-binding membrane subunit